MAQMSRFPHRTQRVADPHVLNQDVVNGPHERVIRDRPTTCRLVEWAAEPSTYVHEDRAGRVLHRDVLVPAPANISVKTAETSATRVS